MLNFINLYLKQMYLKMDCSPISEKKETKKKRYEKKEEFYLRKKKGK